MAPGKVQFVVDGAFSIAGPSLRKHGCKELPGTIHGTGNSPLRGRPHS